MKLLREYIRTLLVEAAKGPQDLPGGVFVTIEVDDGYDVYYSDKSGKRFVPRPESPLHGYVAMDKGHRGRGLGDCLGAYMVVGSEATHGWGPMLYDVIMELAGPDGVMADRSSLSQDAFNVWQVYMTRGDAQQKQLDDVGNTLTPEEEDNCDVDTAIQRSGLKTADMFSGTWNDEKTAELLKNSPVMKVYTKGPTTIGGLEAMGRLIRK